MIRLGVRLTLGGGREAALRALVTAAAVALGVGLLLMALAGVNGLHSQTQRGAWLDTSPTTPRATSTPAADPLWWLLSVDQFGDQAIDRVDVAATGPTSPVPPGLAHLPGPGQYDVSPALERLLASTPTDQLAERFAGHRTGSIGTAGLPSPNSLIIVIGHAAHQLSLVPGAVEVRGIQQTPSSCDACKSGAGSEIGLQWILVIGAIALLLPVLILISTASRLSAARREERFAAMRLVGATPRQISVISAVEATLAACAGVSLGFVLFFLLRPLLYRVPFTGAPLAAGDLALRPIDLAIVVIGVPIAAIVSARLALQRVQISPLGVSRRTTSASPRVFRVIPLLAGIALLAYFDAAGKPHSNSGQQLEFLLGFGLLVVGLVLAGPWFTTAGARLMADRASRPASLIAGRRLLDNPKAAFRFVSGLVIALFITSAAIGALSSIAAASSAGRGSVGSDTLAVPFCGFATNCPASAQVPSVTSHTLAALRATRRSQRCDRGPREPPSPAEELVRAVPRSTRGFVRSRLVRSTGGDTRHREVHSRSDGGECRLFSLERPRTQRSRFHDGVAERAPLCRPDHDAPGRRSGRRHRRVIGLDRTGADVSRTSLSLRRDSRGSRGAQSLDRTAPGGHSGHDCCDHRCQPDHRRLQSRGECDGRVG